ncbi:MAG: hypothetical protein NTW58_10295 [Actinobacteria bacterium]|nr:hypothetical protein [Actinomycetota bacterium]
MPEGNVNAEIANHLREQGEHSEPAADRPSKRRIETIEILEAVLLAIVAIVTALSGYQAARWDGESAKEYATSSRLRTEAQSTALTANQTLIYNAGNFTAWLQAYDAGDKSLQDLLERRFTPEYKVAFDAWVAIDGMNDPSAPPGPRYMEEYEDPLTEKAAEQNKEASHAFDLGVDYRATGEHYVRITVVLAAVLFLIAIGQRFKVRGVRYSVNIVAGIFLVYCLYLFAIYPHLVG